MSWFKMLLSLIMLATVNAGVLQSGQEPASGKIIQEYDLSKLHKTLEASAPVGDMVDAVQSLKSTFGHIQDTDLMKEEDIDDGLFELEFLPVDVVDGDYEVHEFNIDEGDATELPDTSLPDSASLPTVSIKVLVLYALFVTIMTLNMV